MGATLSIVIGFALTAFGAWGIWSQWPLLWIAVKAIGPVLCLGAGALMLMIGLAEFADLRRSRRALSPRSPSRST